MSHRNLTGAEAKAKIKEIAESIDFAMLITDLGQQPLHAVPMSTKLVDEQGSIWFLSGSDSNHNRNIEMHGEAHLVYSSRGKMQFMNLYGKATIHTDRPTLEKLYGTTDDMWFDGLEDQNLTAICIHPSDVQYWDTKDNQIVTLFKMGVAVVQGEKPGVTVSGDLNVN